ncbi:MAG: hypothetical protein ABSC94_29655 [Polyangiaceae bacterium]|jgi:hypothetical protein
MADRSAELAGDGFVRRVTIPAALAHWVWTVDLVFEQDRRLRLVDETVLRLVGAGVSDPDQIARLMGLSESEIVPGAIANLMRLGALVHDGGIHVTEGGGAALSRSAIREPRRDTMQLHLDLHRGTVAVTAGRMDLLSSHEMRGRALHQLPLPPEPTQRDLNARHLLVQASLQARLRDAAGTSAVDLLRAIPTDTPQALFEEVDVEVWHRPADTAWRWRVLVDGLDDEAVTRSLRTLEEEGGEVIPAVPDRLDDELAEADKLLSEWFANAAPSQDQDRFAAIGSGGEITFVVPAFPLAFADLAMLHHLEQEEGRTIRVVVAAASEGTGGKRAADPLHELFNRLRRAGVSTSECRGPFRHGLLLCGPQAFIARYGIDSLPARPGRGVPRVEVRAAAGDVLPAIREFVARIAGQGRRP